MRGNERFIIVLCVLLALAGLFVPWWPFSLLCVIVAALYGRFVLALALACLFDLVYGAPTGALHIVAFPFTLLTLVLVIVRALIARHVRSG